MTTPDDPFAGGDKLPAVSFKDSEHGTTIVFEVTSTPKMVQARDYDTNEPAYWPVKTPGETPNPKMTVVTEGTVDGEPMSLWAAKPSSMFAAIAEAQRQAGDTIKPGGTLSVQFYDTKPSDNPKKAGQKLYRAFYKPPVNDPFAQQTASAAPPAEQSPAAAPAPEPVAAPAAASSAAPPPWA